MELNIEDCDNTRGPGGELMTPGPGHKTIRAGARCDASPDMISEHSSVLVPSDYSCDAICNEAHYTFLGDSAGSVSRARHSYGKKS